MTPSLISISIPRDVFDECIQFSAKFRKHVIDCYAEGMMPPTERIHRDMIRLLSESRDSAVSSGVNKITFIKKIREYSQNGNMRSFYMTFPGFLTGSTDEVMGLADAKRLAEHYVLHFLNKI